MEIREIEWVDPYDWCNNCEQEEPNQLFAVIFNGRTAIRLCEPCLNDLKNMIEEALANARS